MSTTSYLSSLPTELIDYILKHLEFKEIFQEDKTNLSKSLRESTQRLLEISKYDSYISTSLLSLHNSRDEIISIPLYLFKADQHTPIKKRLFDIFENNENLIRVFIANPRTNNTSLAIKVTTNKVLLLSKCLRGTGIETLSFSKHL